MNRPPRRRARALRFSLAAALVGVLCIGIGTPATAATITPTGPLTVLPGAVSAGSTSAGGLGNSNVQAMAFLYKFATSPDTAAALRARQAGGTLTPAQTSLVTQQQTRPVQYPTGAAKTLTKSVSGVLGPLSNFQLGTMVGSVASQAILAPFGIDANQTVCSARASASDLGAGALDFFTGQQCEPYGLAPDYVPNRDSTAGFTMATLTTKNGNRYTYTGTTTGTYNRNSGAYYAAACFAKQGTAPEQGGGNVPMIVAQYQGYYDSQPRTYVDFITPATTDNTQSSFGLCGGNSHAVIYAGPYADPASTANAAAQYTPLCMAPTTPEGYTPARDCSSPGSIKAEKATGNPTRTLDCIVTADNGQTYTGKSAPYTEGGGFIPDLNCPKLPPGVLADTMTAAEVFPGGGQKLWEQKVPAEVNETLRAYPECGDSTCLLELVKKSDNVSCFVNEAGCADWFTDPNKADKFTCRYGTHTVALEQCNTYAPRFTPDAQRTGQLLGDPKTGAATQAPPGASPGADAAAMTPAVPESRRECFAGAISLNPVDWVVVPLKCTFSPRQSVLNATLTKMGTAQANSYPGKLDAALRGWTFDAPSGCSGITVSVFFLGDPFQVGNACPGSMLAPMVPWAHAFGALSFGVAGFLSIRGSIAGVAAFRGGDA